MARKYVSLLLAACSMLLVASCMGGGKKNPTSTGQPYEVVLEGDTDSIVTQVLAENVPCLPQPEPMFNLIQVRKNKSGQLYQMVRNRVVVDVNSHNPGYSVKVSKDVVASPQLVIRIKAQSVEQLKTRLNGEQLRNLIDEHELKHLAAVIKPNAEKQKLVKELFGIDMKVPLDMESSKQGKDFLWLSNNANSGMQSLIFLKVKSEERRVKEVKSEERRVKNSLVASSYTAVQSQVDALLRKNMVGETDSMYMVIPQLSARGLWEMRGDAMGGPYVMRRISDKKRKCDLVVIGFVYAPEMKKRNLIKQLEAVLTTINIY